MIKNKKERYYEIKKITLGLLVFYLVALTLDYFCLNFEFSIADLPHLRNINLIPFADSVYCKWDN